MGLQLGADTGGTPASITYIRIVPGYDLIEGLSTDELGPYVIGRTGRNDNGDYLGICNFRDNFTCNLPLKIPFNTDQMRAIAGFRDNPALNGLGRYVEDIPGFVGPIDWGIPVRIDDFIMHPIADL